MHSFRANQSLAAIARDYGAREPWRVASIIDIAVSKGRDPADVIEEVRRNDPSLFYRGRDEPKKPKR